MPRTERNPSPALPQAAQAALAVADTGAQATASASGSARHKRTADEALQPRGASGALSDATSPRAPRTAVPRPSAQQQALHAQHAEPSQIGAAMQRAPAALPADPYALGAAASTDSSLHNRMHAYAAELSSDAESAQPAASPHVSGSASELEEVEQALAAARGSAAQSQIAGQAAHAAMPAGLAADHPLVRVNSGHLIDGRRPSNPNDLKNVQTTRGFARAVKDFQEMAPQSRFQPHHRQGSDSQTMAPVRALYAKHRAAVANGPRIEPGFEAAAITALAANELKSMDEDDIHMKPLPSGGPDGCKIAGAKQGLIAPFVADQVGADADAVHRIRNMPIAVLQWVNKVAQLPLADQRLLSCILPNGLSISPAGPRDGNAELLGQSVTSLSACWSKERAALQAANPQQQPAGSFAEHVSHLLQQGMTGNALKDEIGAMIDRQDNSIAKKTRNCMTGKALEAIEAELERHPVQ